MKSKNKIAIKQFFLLFSFAVFAFSRSVAGTNASSGWSSNPFNQKVFIENIGQFNFNSKDFPGKILFSASVDGIEMYFSANGLTYTHYESEPMSEREREKFELEKNKGEEEKGEVKLKTVLKNVSVKWLGANPNTVVESEDAESFYYTYSHNIKASAFKKIIYKNIYPNIDVEYVLPEKGGLKYSLILHPGANPADIKMKWSEKEISQDEYGNIAVKSSFGDFIDHAPQTFYEKGNPIASSFSLNGNILSFSLSSYDKNKTVIIDPWTSSPTFSMNKAYDVDYDYNGNVYAYGSWAPSFQLAKFNSGGALQWVYNAALMMRYVSFYGDFAVDPFTGASYLGEGCDESAPTAPAMVIKVNTAGQLVDSVKISTGPWQFEIWRMDFDICTRTVLAAGGGINPSSPQATLLDINLNIVTSSQPVFAAANDVDVALCTIDKYSNGTRAYMLPNAMMSLNPRPYDNALKQVVYPSLTSGSWITPTGHLFTELGSLTYVGPPVGATCSRPVSGYNGIAASQNYVYTYDSDSLKRWDKNTGAAAGAIDASPTPPVIGNPGNFCFAGFVPSIQTSWGGLDVDECDNNVYVGVDNAVKVYDASMNLTNTFNLPNKVYDVKLGINDKLYACGNGFVTQIDLAPTASTTITYSASSTPATGCSNCNGTASANAVGTVPCGPPPVFTYSWSPTGQTTQNITGLCPGNYTVTISRNCAVAHTETVQITGGGIVTATAASSPTTCGNNNGSASVTVTSGVSPYTYTWSPSVGSTSAVSNLAAGNYTVTVTDAVGCSDTQVVNVTPSTNITATAGPNPTICSGQSANLTATGGGNYSWTNGNTNSSITVSPTANTTYSVVVTLNGCSDTAAAAVSVNPLPNPTATGNTICVGQTASISATGGGTYSWSNGNTNPSQNVSPSTTTAYSVTVTVNGCTATTSATVNVNPLPTPSVPSPTICNGDIATLTASGGVNYSWSNGSSANPMSVNPTVTTTYTVIAVDANGCSNNTTAVVIVNPLPVASAAGSTICIGQSGALSAAGGGTYSWSNGNTNSSQNISPSATTNYSVIVSVNGCLDTAFAAVTVNSLPSVNVPNSTICAGDIATLTASGGISYSWSTGATTNPILVNPSATSAYSVAATDANGCSNSTAVTVNISLPPIAASTSATICSGQTASLTASGGGNYLWSNGNTNSSINVSPSSTSNYSVIVSFGSSCSDTAYSSVSVNQSPLLSLGNSQTLCDGQNLTLNAGNPGASYVWSTGATTQSIIVAGMGTYWVIVGFSNCLAMDTVQTFIAPHVNLGDSNLCTTSPIVLDPGSGASGYLWSNGSTTQTISVDIAGTYWVVATFGNCLSGDSAEITGDGTGGSLFIPNAFTPNGDHLNEIFQAKGTGIKSFDMRIFDRWGNLIFYSDDVNKGWSGKVEGGHYPLKADGEQPSQEDVYVWKINYTSQCFPKRIRREIGRISIVK